MLLSSSIFRRCLHTIYALSSGRCPSGVAIVRISGPGAQQALVKLAKLEADITTPRHAYFRRLVHPATGQLIDRGLTIWFPKPNSFTGEDVVEFHVHGGPQVVRLLYNALANLPDYRMAEPGEFMRRSFKNGKIDLAGAEAVSDLIVAETEAQHALAVGQIERTQERVELFVSWRSSILNALAAVEAWIDFSESDDVEEGVLAKTRQNMVQLRDEIQRRMADARRGQRLRDGLHVAIVGPPNAGKSSLMNALCRDDEVSIVSPVAGTTRDAIERPCNIAGYPIILVDTAGLRCFNSDGDDDNNADAIEQIGIARSKSRARTADLLVVVLDAWQLKQQRKSWLEAITATINHVTTTKHNNQDDEEAPPIIVVLNKVDLLDETERNCFIHQNSNNNAMTYNLLRRNAIVCSMSCLSRVGFDTFLNAIACAAVDLCGGDQNNKLSSSSSLLTNLRQHHHLKSTADLLQSFINHHLEKDEKDAVIGAEFLRLAVRELGKLTGEITNDDVLDQIFRTFCVGK